MSSRIKPLLLIGAITSLVLFNSCSFSTTFAVVNASNERIQVRYVIKRPTPTSVPGFETPSVMKVSDLGDSDVAWAKLPESRFTLNEETRTAVVTVMPQEALRVEQISGRTCEGDRPNDLESFAIEEINITGANGTIRLTGEQARKSFVNRKRKVCELLYQ